AGMYAAGRDCVRSADVVLLAGARSFMEFDVPRGPELPPGAKVVHLHPDAGEVAKVHGVDVALVGDVSATLSDLLEELAEAASAAGAGEFRAAAREEHRGLRDKVLTPRRGSGRLDATDVLLELAAELDDRTTVIGDATTSGGTLLHAMELA